MKKYNVPTSSPVPDLEALDDMFLGTTIPIPDLEGSVHKVMLGPYVVEYIDGHKRGVGAGSPDNFQYHLKIKDWPPQRGVWRHYRHIPQCHEMIQSYRAAILSTDPAAFDPPRRKPRKDSAVIN